MDLNFEGKIIAARGQKGRQILDNIPQLINKYENAWNIQILPPYPLSYNYVAPATDSEGKRVVFKIGLHGHDEFMPEFDALTIFNGNGIVKLIKSDTSSYVIRMYRTRHSSQPDRR